MLLKKNSELKAQIRSAHLEDQANLTINSDMRRVLWQSLGEKITFASKFISADQVDEKKLWPKIEPMLPMYRLFKADRPSTDPEGYKPNTVKRKLNRLCAPKMTMQLLRERDPADEVLGWLRDISSIAQE